MSVSQLSALAFLLGVIGLVCYLVVFPIFSTLSMTHGSVPYPVMVIVVSILPVFLVVFTGLIFYLSRR